MKLERGQKFGQYEIVGLLGHGGMGIVFRALHRDLGREVALKILSLDEEMPETGEVPAVPPDRLKRFEREVRIQLAASHPHVVRVYDACVLGGIPYLAMELVEGTTLQRVLEELAPLPAPDVISFSSQIADALAYLHAQEIIHRDLKPRNVLVAPGKVVKLADFGLATAPDEVRLTKSRQIVGTVRYMAPESLKGHVGAPADLFALGLMMHEMVTGTLPYRGGTMMEWLTQLAKATPRPVRELAPATPAGLAEVIDLLLSKDPAVRPNAIQVSAALGNPPTSYPSRASAGGSTPRRTRRTRKLPEATAARRPRSGPAWILGALVVVPLLMLIVWGAAEATRWRGDSGPRPPATSEPTVGPGQLPAPSSPAVEGPGALLLTEFCRFVRGRGLPAKVHAATDQPSDDRLEETAWTVFHRLRFGRQIGAGRLLSGFLVTDPGALTRLAIHFPTEVAPPAVGSMELNAVPLDRAVAPPVREVELPLSQLKPGINMLTWAPATSVRSKGTVQVHQAWAITTCSRSDLPEPTFPASHRSQAESLMVTWGAVQDLAECEAQARRFVRELPAEVAPRVLLGNLLMTLTWHRVQLAPVDVGGLTASEIGVLPADKRTAGETLAEGLDILQQALDRNPKAGCAWAHLGLGMTLGGSPTLGLLALRQGCILAPEQMEPWHLQSEWGMFCHGRGAVSQSLLKELIATAEHAVTVAGKDPRPKLVQLAQAGLIGLRRLLPGSPPRR